MLNEALKDQILQTKLVYLNGYLASLAAINSFSVVGMKYKLFAYNFSAGNVAAAIQHNSYELFGVYPNDWNLALTEVNDWKERLEIELIRPIQQQSVSSDKEQETIRELKSRIKNSINGFVTLLEKEFGDLPTTVYESTVTKGGFYRIMGIDLVFEIEETKIIFLQIRGTD